MDTYRSHTDVPRSAQGSTCVIGNFDGIHQGHQSVIDTARTIATRTCSPLAVMTFEPHPRSFFAPDGEPFRLMNPLSRSLRLAALGIDVLFELPFDRALATMTAAAFASDVLSEGLGLAHAVVGRDFRYGVRRAGTFETLIADCRTHAIEVTIVPELTRADHKVSSTAIRAALRNGDVRTAAALLGTPHTIAGPVIPGERRGRTLGFPTANLALDDLLQPRAGVYAVRVRLNKTASQVPMPAVASIGIKPTFGTHPPSLEVHIFDFDADIYGQLIAVELIAFLRPEITFASPEDLIDQMHTDCQDARAQLAALD